METHWYLVAILSMVACGNGNRGTDTGGPVESAAGSSGAQNANGGDGTANTGGAAGASGAGAAGEAEQVLADGPGSADAGFETSPLFLTRMRQPMKGLASSPHGIVQIFYSNNIEAVLGRDHFPALPTGTIALKKQDRDGNGTVDQIMVMLKQPPGTQPKYGDWIYEQRDPTSFALVSSSATTSSFGDFCAGCHREFSATDGLAGSSLSD